MSQNYTLCEVRLNNGKNGKPVWIVVKGAVYDLTKFIKEHPGGEEAIMEYAGKDATKAFNQVGHSTDAIRDMKLYKIGTVASECIPHLESELTTKSTKAVITTTPTPCHLITNEKMGAVMNPPLKQCCGLPEEQKIKYFCCW